MSEAEKIQVAVAHANPLVAAGLKSAILACTDLEIVERGARVVVGDYETGIQFMDPSRARGARVLIVTDDHSEVSIRLAVELGVAGYLPLHSPLESVVRAIRCIHRGGTAIDPLALSRIATSLASPALTAREMQVLRLVMQGMRDKAIALKLKRTVGTAKSHVKAILNKLGATSRVEAIAVARRRGLLPEDTLVPQGDFVRSNRADARLDAHAPMP